MSTDEVASTESVDPLHTAMASEISTSAPTVAEMVPLPGSGAAREPPIERSAAATVPPLTWMVPAGSMAVSPAPGVPTGDQLPGIVHAEAVVAVQVNVVPAMTPPKSLLAGNHNRYDRPLEVINVIWR